MTCYTTDRLNSCTEVLRLFSLLEKLGWTTQVGSHQQVKRIHFFYTSECGFSTFNPARNHSSLSPLHRKTRFEDGDLTQILETIRDKLLRTLYRFNIKTIDSSFKSFNKGCQELLVLRQLLYKLKIIRRHASSEEVSSIPMVFFGYQCIYKDNTNKLR